MIATAEPPLAPGVNRIVLTAAPVDLSATRRALRDRLRTGGLTPTVVRGVEQVVTELLGAVFEHPGADSADVIVTCYRLIVSVRVRSRRPVDLDDGPFGIRERLVGSNAFAWGRRERSDGTVELWAEVARER